MNDDRWRKAWDVFRAAREDRDTADSSVLEHVTDDPELLDHVLNMLETQEEIAPQPGQVFGRYEIVTMLGRGGMGEVYSAHDTDLSRPVALKFLNPRMVGIPSAVDRLSREAKAASALNHPNIVTVYEVTHFVNGLAIATELVDGAPLRERCGARQPLEHIILWCQQIARGLAAAHAAGIVHGDIKPENVMLRRDGFVKILDFGLARRIGAGESIEELPLGTVGYMSPEQTRGQALTGASDIFSLGVMLFELATGVHPFLAGSNSETTRAILQNEPNFPEPGKRAPSRLEGLLRAMLAKDPKDRPSAVQVADRLIEIARRPTRWWIWISTPAAVAAAVAIAVWAWPAQRSEPVGTPRIVPFTTYEGTETEPALSADGSRIAFVWTGQDGSNKDIYVKAIGEDRPRRLTSDPTEDFSPAFSPDGKRIAFLRRQSGSSEPDVIVIPADGGAEKAVGRIDPTSGFRGLTWWPDGESLLVRDLAGAAAGLVRIFLNDGHKQIVTSPPASYSDGQPSFAPDGKRFAFLRYHASAFQICLMSTAVSGAGGTPACVYQGRARELAWMPDGKGLIFTDSPGLWRIRLQGDKAATPVKITDGVFNNLAGSRNGRRLAFSKTYSDVNVWRVGRDGKNPTRLIASSGEDSSPDWSPDGSRLLVRSNRSGNFELYTYARDGSDERQITSLGSHLDNARWSPDGAWIAFDCNRAPVDASIKHHNVYVVPASGGAARRLTDDAYNYTIPSWSRDGRWIYYLKEANLEQTWKLPVAGGDPVQVDPKSLNDLVESADGQYLYYTKYRGASGVWRRPVAGGPEELLAGTEKVQLFRYWSLVRDGVFFVNGPPNAEIRFLDFRTKLTVRIAELPPKLATGPRGMAVSWDGTQILYDQEDVKASDIMLIEDIL